MKRFSLITLFALCFSSSLAMADPIQDGIWNVYKAAWFPSSGTPCSKICNRPGVQAEHEYYYVPSFPNKINYVCKAKLPSLTLPPTTFVPPPQWLYGNNFDSPNLAPYCMTVNHLGKVQRHKRFFCLCVAK